MCPVQEPTAMGRKQTFQDSLRSPFVLRQIGSITGAKMSTDLAKPAAGKAPLRVADKLDKSQEQVHADLALNPAVNAAATVQAFGAGTIGKLEISETLEAVMQTVAKVRKGDMSGPEAVLVAQASALNSIFTELARRAALNMAEYIEASEKYMRLALKAQAQCRATIETLAEMKNPPLVIARQANVANGPQQVNNGAPLPRA